MKTNKTALILSVVGLTTLSLSLRAQTVTFTSDNGELQGLSSATPGTGATASYVNGSPGYWDLSSPDDVVNGEPQKFNDTAMILVNNGYSGSSPLGTLNSLLGQGAAGNVSFNILSMKPGSQYAYWDVLLTDPNNAANTMVINAYSDNQLGANPLNQGESVDASTELLNGTTWSELFEPWAAVETNAPIAGDPTLADWNVSQLSISVGGWGSGSIQDAEISSVTVPGPAGAPIGDSAPDTVSTLVLLMITFGGLATLRLRSQRV